MRGHLTESVDGWAEALIASGRVVGLGVGVTRSGETLLARGYGLEDCETNVSATAQTIFRIGSLTKQITAAVLLQLSESNVLSLDDPVSKWLPETAAWGRIARVRDLLQHTSGAARDVPDLDQLTTSTRRTGDEARAAALVAAAGAEFSPRTAWRYSNGGYLLAGWVVERATGRPFSEQVSTRLLDPLGLSDTYYADASPSGAQLATGYDLSGDGRIGPAELLNLGAVGASGALCSTVLDLLAWDRAIATDAILTSGARKMAALPALLEDGRAVGYGLGVFLADVDGHRELAHRGDIPGASAFKAHYPDADLSVVVLTNTLGAPAAALGRRVARHVLGVPIPRAVTRPISAGDRARLVGVYRDGRRLVRLIDDGADLIAETPDGLIQLIRNENDDLISKTDPDLQFTFGGGQLREPPQSLSVIGPGLRFEARRAPE